MADQPTSGAQLRSKWWFVLVQNDLAFSAVVATTGTVGGIAAGAAGFFAGLGMSAVLLGLRASRVRVACRSDGVVVVNLFRSYKIGSGARVSMRPNRLNTKGADRPCILTSERKVIVHAAGFGADSEDEFDQLRQFVAGCTPQCR